MKTKMKDAEILKALAAILNIPADRVLPTLLEALGGGTKQAPPGAPVSPLEAIARSAGQTHKGRHPLAVSVAGGAPGRSEVEGLRRRIGGKR